MIHSAGKLLCRTSAGYHTLPSAGLSFSLQQRYSLDVFGECFVLPVAVRGYGLSEVVVSLLLLAQ